DRLVGFVLMSVSLLVVCGALAAVVRAPAPAARPYVAASASVHVVYMSLLMRSYRLGDFNQMYPLARGTSPWVVAIFAAGFADETLSPVRLAGVVIVSAGLATLVAAGGVPRRQHLP